jgi:hypothetical protein
MDSLGAFGFMLHTLPLKGGMTLKMILRRQVYYTAGQEHFPVLHYIPKAKYNCSDGYKTHQYITIY